MYNIFNISQRIGISLAVEAGSINPIASIEKWQEGTNNVSFSFQALLVRLSRKADVAASAETPTPSSSTWHFPLEEKNPTTSPKLTNKQTNTLGFLMVLFPAIYFPFLKHFTCLLPRSTSGIDKRKVVSFVQQGVCHGSPGMIGICVETLPHLPYWFLKRLLKTL